MVRINRECCTIRKKLNKNEFILLLNYNLKCNDRNACKIIEITEYFVFDSLSEK